MLLRFGVQNFRSIRDMQEMSLVASGLDDPTAGLIDCPPLGRHLLPALVIYGANASGKSNLVKALRWMRDAVLLSHTRGDPAGGVPCEAFALDQEWSDRPTACNLDFLVEDVRYHYGLEATNKAFTREWLHSFPNGRRQTLFERKLQHFEFGRNLRGRNRVIADLTRPNSLFVASATQNDHDELSRVSGFFRAIIDDERETGVRRNELDPRTLEFLGTIGTGIIRSCITKVEVSDEQQKLARELMGMLKRVIDDVPDVPRSDGNVELPRLELAHRGKDGSEVLFLMSTKRVMGRVD